MKKNLIIAFLLLITIITMSQLKHPLSKQDQNIIERTVDKFLDKKIYNNLWKRTFHFITFFESLDGFSLTADVNSIDHNDVLITTAATTDDVASLLKQPSIQGLITFSQKSNMRTAFMISSIADATSYMIVGTTSSGEYYGFKIIDDTLYGVSYDGTTESTVKLQTISISTVYGIEARFVPNSKIIFYVDSVEKGAKSNNLPSGISSGVAVTNISLMQMSITANANAAKTLQFSFFEYLQSRNVLR